MKLLSQEMLDDMVKRAEADAEFPSSVKGLSIRLLLVATDCPDNDDRQATLIMSDGKFTDVSVEAKPAPSDLRTAPFDKTKYDARVISPYGPLCDLLTEKMSLVAAFGHVKVDGDLPKLMTQVEGFVALLKFIGSLPIEY